MHFLVSFLFLCQPPDVFGVLVQIADQYNSLIAAIEIHSVLELEHRINTTLDIRCFALKCKGKFIEDAPFFTSRDSDVVRFDELTFDERVNIIHVLPMIKLRVEYRAKYGVAKTDPFHIVMKTDANLDELLANIRASMVNPDEMIMVFEAPIVSVVVNGHALSTNETSLKTLRLMDMDLWAGYHDIDLSVGRHWGLIRTKTASIEIIESESEYVGRLKRDPLPKMTSQDTTLIH